MNESTQRFRACWLYSPRRPRLVPANHREISYYNSTYGLRPSRHTPLRMDTGLTATFLLLQWTEWVTVRGCGRREMGPRLFYCLKELNEMSAKSELSRIQHKVNTKNSVAVLFFFFLWLNDFA